MLASSGAQSHVGPDEEPVPLDVFAVRSGAPACAGALLRFRVLLLAAVVAVEAFGASAQADQLFLRWNECAAGGGAPNQPSACAGSLGRQVVYPSFRLSTSVDSVVALECVIDLQHAADPLPPWWRLEPGGCRAGQLLADTDYSASSGCIDTFGGFGGGLVQSFRPSEPFGSPSQARILLTVSAPSTQLASLTAGEEYYAGRLLLYNGNTSGCSGCTLGACMVFNSLLIKRLPGATPEEISVTNAGGLAEQSATWQGGAGAPCDAVPVRNSSWGRLKSLYR